MHELSIAEDIFAIIEQSMGKKASLKSVDVTIGPLSGILPDALSFVFCEVAEFKGFGRPELVMHKTDAKILCVACNNEYSTHDLYATCPKCNSMDRTILSGDEFTVDSVELLEDSHV